MSLLYVLYTPSPVYSSDDTDGVINCLLLPEIVTESVNVFAPVIVSAVLPVLCTYNVLSVSCISADVSIEANLSVTYDSTAAPDTNLFVASSLL